MFPETNESDLIEDNFSDGEDLDADIQDDEEELEDGVAEDDPHAVMEESSGSESGTEEEDEQQQVAVVRDQGAPIVNSANSNPTDDQVQADVGFRSSLLPQLSTQELLDFDHVHTFLAGLLLDAAKRNTKPFQVDIIGGSMPTNQVT
jgi:hypothetical protein